jgi:hypothetical protein
MKYLVLIILITASSYLNALDKLKPGELPAKSDFDITDQERHDSQNFVHEGLSQRQMLEACEKLKDASACQGNGKTQFLGVDSTIVQALAKAYSQFAGVLAATKSAGEEKDGESSGEEGEGDEGAEGADAEEGKKDDDKKDKEEGNDYCVYIPMVGEQVGAMMQQNGQQEIEKATESVAHPQKDQLYKASRSHGLRADTAEMQGMVWGATTACYVATMFTGKVGPKSILKISAAGFLTFFWISEAKQQEDYSDKVRKIADELPGVGDCNPITEPNCYCAQPETEYDPKYCLEPLRQKHAKKTEFQVPCTTAALESDPKCVCVGLDNCLDNRLFTNIGAPGMVSFGATNSGSDVKNLFRGVISSSSLNTGTSNQAARTSKILNSIKDKVGDKSGLSKSQLAQSSYMEKLGTPSFIARQLATGSVNSYGQKKARLYASAAPSSGFRQGVAGKLKKRSNVMRFSGASKIGGKKQVQKRSNNFNPYKKKKVSHNKQDVLSFSNKAQNAADITRKNQRTLLEIISRRYRISGRRRLGLE